MPKSFTTALVISVVVLLSSCASDRGGEASADYLHPSGWQDVAATLSHPSFTAYAVAVKAEVARYRMPLNEANAKQEVDWASPSEVPPDASCIGDERGIAILVHGLSDTAFAMHDIAQVLASACYRARTVLLPGHGTRAGDLLSTRYKHWVDTVDYLIKQASAEHDHIVVGGFSLGAVLTLTAALQPNSPVDAVIAFSPAYHLSSYRLARWAPWVHPFKRWIDRGVADDAMRYEAMPTRGVAETVRSMKAMKRTVSNKREVSIPWLMVQSLDDAVTAPLDNIDFFERHATHPASRMINFYTNVTPPGDTIKSRWLPGFDETMQVIGLTHLATHISPDNQHYGANGSYRNCGSTGPRNAVQVEQCTSADPVWYGLWNDSAPDGSASAMSTFNPQFNELKRLMVEFLDGV